MSGRIGKSAAPEAFAHLGQGQADNVPNLEMTLDVPVAVSVEIGRARMTVREFLRLAKGSVVELDKPVGEPLEVFVNGKLVAKGEAVVVNERFGIRLTEVVSAGERAQRLR
ncbi:MAG: flagellar motor switch protein FliN [Deltaproteobacteria bacterium RIFCSPLOWO2_02_FULL_53_8]|nr:MAG: flagellar motor switch protein FliN [Deltaproteobacteria bacterium RIFCSPLOWO2_02_FULL_53_8]